MCNLYTYKMSAEEMRALKRASHHLQLLLHDGGCEAASAWASGE